jgi:hypothetical protein
MHARVVYATAYVLLRCIHVSDKLIYTSENLFEIYHKQDDERTVKIQYSHPFGHFFKQAGHYNVIHIYTLQLYYKCYRYVAL